MGHPPRLRVPTRPRPPPAAEPPPALPINRSTATLFTDCEKFL